MRKKINRATTDHMRLTHMRRKLSKSKAKSYELMALWVWPLPILFLTNRFEFNSTGLRPVGGG